MVASELENISGIGESKRRKLLQTFISVERIKSATIDELSDVLDKRSAENVYKYFHS